MAMVQLWKSETKLDSQWVTTRSWYGRPQLGLDVEKVWRQFYILKLPSVDTSTVLDTFACMLKEEMNLVYSNRKFFLLRRQRLSVSKGSFADMVHLFFFNMHQTEWNVIFKMCLCRSCFSLLKMLVLQLYILGNIIFHLCVLFGARVTVTFPHSTRVESKVQ